MKKEKIKKNKIYPVNLQQSRGFVLLFAVVLSSIILAITMGVLDISLKEINFSTEAKETNDAFFAADTGAECALLYDKNTGSSFESPSSPSLTCNGSTFIANESPPNYWSFIVPDLGKDGKGCAIVTVDKRDSATTKVISKGYNNGSPSCASTSNTVERQLELSY